MKKLISMFALSLFATLPSAFADYVQMGANDFASLPDCGGVIQTKVANDGSQLNLVFGNVSQCSNFDIVGANGEKVNYPNQKLGGSIQSRSGSFTIPSSLIELGKNTIRVKIQSNSAKHSDTIVITVRAISTPSRSDSKTGTVYMTSTSVKTLNACGGVVQTKVSGGQLNIIFQGVTECSNFDIVAANGDKINYPNQKLGGREGFRSGSFTVPERVIEFGGNIVRVQLKSNSGKTSEKIVISFIAL